MVTSPLRLRSDAGDVDRSRLQTDSYGDAARRYAKSLPAYKRAALRQRSARGKADALRMRRVPFPPVAGVEATLRRAQAVRPCCISVRFGRTVGFIPGSARRR